jgi:hypothetical protein
MSLISDIYNKTKQSVSNVGSSIYNALSGPTFSFDTVNSTPSSPKKTESYNIRGVDITEDDINNYRPLFYGEVSGRNPDKKRLENQVILNTAINRAYEYSKKYGRPVSISEVLSMPNQYQAYGSDQYNNYSSPRDYLSELKKKETDNIINETIEQLKSGKFKDITNGAFYYVHNPDGSITYDNTKKLFKD